MQRAIALVTGVSRINGIGKTMTSSLPIGVHTTIKCPGKYLKTNPN